MIAPKSSACQLVMNRGLNTTMATRLLFIYVIEPAVLRRGQDTRRFSRPSTGATNNKEGNHKWKIAQSRLSCERTRERLELSPTDLGQEGVDKIAGELRRLLADVFALYIKSKNFHWHMSGPHFRDYHLLLDEQAQQIFAMTDDVAERARKIGGSTLRSIGDIARNQRLHDNDEKFVAPEDMLADNQRLTRSLRFTHEVCQRNNDVATASLIENWIDETERRAWFLFETRQSG